MNLLKSISHSLQAVNGFFKIYNMRQLHGKPPEYGSLFIKKTLNQLLVTIEEVMAIYQLQQEKPVKNSFFDLNKLVDELFQFYSFSADAKGIKLSYSTPFIQPDSIIWSDEKRLRLMLQNLLDNAMKFTDEGYVKFGYDLGPDNQVILYVKDTGIGINEEEEKRIFEMYYRSPDAEEKKIEGAGIGLGIVSHLSVILSTEVKVVSEYGKGSSFSFFLRRDSGSNNAINGSIVNAL